MSLIHIHSQLKLRSGHSCHLLVFHLFSHFVHQHKNKWKQHIYNLIICPTAVWAPHYCWRVLETRMKHHLSKVSPQSGSPERFLTNKIGALQAHRILSLSVRNNFTPSSNPNCFGSQRCRLSIAHKTAFQPLQYYMVQAMNEAKENTVCPSQGPSTGHPLPPKRIDHWKTKITHYWMRIQHFPVLPACTSPFNFNDFTYSTTLCFTRSLLTFHFRLDTPCRPRTIH